LYLLLDQIALIQIIHDRIKGSGSRLISLDARWVPSDQPKATVVFCHGYKGFKDWGAWDLVANAFAEQGFLFVKFNFSYNGTSTDALQDFTDLEAFGQNNYSKEVKDLKLACSWARNTSAIDQKRSKGNVHLVGHSRGGGIALLAAASLEIKSLATWAGVSDFETRFPFGRALIEWREKGVFHVLNSRTGQKLPHNIQFLDDFLENEEDLDIRTKTRMLNKPFLILHGLNDEAVHISEAMRLNKWGVLSSIEFIPNGSHTFGATHPWGKEYLPYELSEVVERTVSFFK
jgi:pimeloyl-ACP methyl ester carboxylesterase